MEAYQQNLILSLLAYSIQKDISAEQLCALSRVDLAALKKRSDVQLTPEQVNDLWRNASTLSNDPLFGLHFGESMQLAALGIVGEIIQNSRTIGEALTHATDLIQLITDMFEMEVVRTGQTFTIHFIPGKESEKKYPFAFRQMMELAMVFVLHETDGLILDKVKPKKVSLPYQPSDLPEYERVLRCTSIQSAEEYTITFDDRYWDEPILLANYELQSLLLQKASIMQTDSSTSKQSVKERISTFLLANAYLGVPTLEEIAANFNTSPRSLQRKLQDEGVTYQQLADSIRKSLALHYLASGKYPIKEISYILGYNELSAFSRAFKRWTGTTPVNYQKR